MVKEENQENLVCLDLLDNLAQEVRLDPKDL